MEQSADSLGLYVHLPWCLAKCPYCDFNSHVLKDSASLDAYVVALERDLERASGIGAARFVSSVFLGGGTPTVFSPRQIERILRAVHENLTVADDAEVTIEANPGSLGEYRAADHRLADYRGAGVNRLSLGAQSFSAEALARLGRIHGPEEILSAFSEARAAGFDNINLDIMFGLPGQTLEQAESDIDAALSLAPEHVSYYELTLEPNTVFYARPPDDLPGDDTMAAIQDMGLARLAAAGYERYEISAFARSGRECRHNLTYWRFGDYLGVGAGAHGKWVDGDGVTWRSRKLAHPAAYVQGLARGEAGESWQVPERDLVFEFALNALRLLDGFTEREFSSRTGLPAASLTATLLPAARDGLVDRRDSGRWAPSALGLRYLNDLQARFLPPAGRAEPAN